MPALPKIRRAHPRSPGQVVAEAVEAINARDMERLSSVLHRRFSATPASPFFSGGRSHYHGPEGLATWLRDVDAQWGAFRLETTDVRERGMRAFVALAATAAPRRARASISKPIYVICEIQQGQIRSVRSYDGDVAAALAAFRL